MKSKDQREIERAMLDLSSSLQKLQNSACKLVNEGKSLKESDIKSALLELF